VSSIIQQTQEALTNHEEEATTALRAGESTVQCDGEVSRNEQERPQAEHGQVRKSSPRRTRTNHRTVRCLELDSVVATYPMLLRGFPKLGR